MLLMRIVVVVFSSHRFPRGNSVAENNKMVMSYTGDEITVFLKEILT